MRKSLKKKKKNKNKKSKRGPQTRCQTNRDEKLAYNGKPTDKKGPCETRLFSLSRNQMTQLRV